MAVLNPRAILILACASLASGCGLSGRGGVPASDPDIMVTVLNPSYAPVSVAVCAPTGCSPLREIAGEREAEFSFSPSGGTRTVVTAKRGDRVIDQQPLDFLPGQRYRVVLDIP